MTRHRVGSPHWAGRTLDSALDRLVVPGYTRIGHAVRRRLPHWPADPAPGSLAGKHVAVTGATSGLGTATAAGALALGAHVHLVVRDVAKGERVAAELTSAAGSSGALGAEAAQVTVWRCDVSDLDSVREFVAEFAPAVPQLEALVHNAGALPATRTESAQGHELTMALHVLGPVAMTEGLLPVLTDGARVVMVTSGGMYTQRLRADDPDFHEQPYTGTAAYARSKRAQVELLPVLQRRWSPEHVMVHAMHPGWADSPGLSSSLPGFSRVLGPLLRTAESGADTSVWLLASPGLPGGRLWHDRSPRPTHVLPTTRVDDAEVWRMWEWVARSAGLEGSVSTP